ncbi:MAG: hypothetical protein BZ137_04285 [Methanosphaera sp. rholeuAM130]|nr:MAG: hypothetical protein BZ137_04285 [Methanosphaera sp. rholeuAM130]
MKICQHCGYENQDTSKFCLSCGNNLQNLSPQEAQVDTNNDNPYQPNLNINNDLDYQPNNTPNVESQDTTGGNYQQPYDNQQYNNGSSNQQSNQQYNNGPYNTGQYNNIPNAQGGYYPPANQKNVWIAVLLNLIAGIFLYFLSGIGHFYLGLPKRAIALCLIGFIPIILNFMFMYSDTGYILILLIGIAYVVYCAYDAYVCTKAINENRPIPLLFGVFDLQ